MTDINALDDEGQTQLHRAADAGDVDKVACLLADKADPELKDNRGFVRFVCFAARCVAQMRLCFKITRSMYKSPVRQINAASYCLVERKRESCTRVDRRTRES